MHNKIFLYFCSVSAFYLQSASVVKMLDVAAESKLGNCLGTIMNRNPHRSYTTEQLLNEMTSCPLNLVNTKEFMQFWLFDSPVPILHLKVVEEEKQNHLELSYSLICPLKTIYNDKCPTVQDLRFTPHFTLSFYNISGHSIMPTIIFESDKNDSFPLTFDFKQNPLFIGNAKSLSVFLIQYPDETYMAFIKWSLKHWVFKEKEKDKKFAVSQSFFRLNPSRLLFFVTDMFELSSRNIIRNVKMIYLRSNTCIVKSLQCYRH